MTCNAFGWPPPSYRWLPPEDSRTIERQTGLFTSIDLSFPSGFMQSDEGAYACILNRNDTLQQFHPGSESISLLATTERQSPTSKPCKVTSPTIFFQHRVLTRDCLEWSERTKRDIASNFIFVLIGGVLSQCPNCSSGNGNDGTITTKGPTCSQEKPGAALFTTTISNEALGRTEAIFCALRTWWELEPLVKINGELWQADGDCVIYINGTGGEEECSPAAVRRRSVVNIALSAIFIVGTLIFASIAGFIGLLGLIYW